MVQPTRLWFQNNMKLNIRETVLFGFLGALMFSLKWITEILPNIHLLGVFIVALTVVYRAKALYPIYTYIFINGFVAGFATWWLPYLYIWLLLWLATMLLPKKMPAFLKPILYTAICGAHGFLFGVLYAPAQALLFGLNFKATIAWIISGLPFDIIHGVSNTICGAILIVPIILALQKANKHILKITAH